MNARHVIRGSALLLAGWLASGAAVCVGADGPRKNFVSCPIVRDTASVPCWLAEYEGELYFLTLQSDVTSPVTPPWLGHRVLVEGTVSAEPRICGGIVLKPVHLSVMPEPDASCNTMLPAEERYNLTFEPPRPPGPSKGRLAFDNAPPPAKPSPAALPSTKEFVVPYDFDGAGRIQPCAGADRRAGVRARRERAGNRDRRLPRRGAPLEWTGHGRRRPTSGNGARSSWRCCCRARI